HQDQAVALPQGLENRPVVLPDRKRGLHGRAQERQTSAGQEQHRQDRQRQSKHETRRHEFAAFGEADSQNHQEQSHQNVRDVKGFDDGRGAKRQKQRENGGGDEGDSAAGLDQAHHAPGQEQHDIDPQNSHRYVWHGKIPALIGLGPHLQDFPGVAGDGYAQGPATDLTINYKLVFRLAGFKRQLEALSTIGTLN